MNLHDAYGRTIAIIAMVVAASWLFAGPVTGEEGEESEASPEADISAPLSTPGNMLKGFQPGLMQNFRPKSFELPAIDPLKLQPAPSGSENIAVKTCARTGPLQYDDRAGSFSSASYCALNFPEGHRLKAVSAFLQLPESWQPSMAALSADSSVEVRVRRDKVTFDSLVDEVIAPLAGSGVFPVSLPDGQLSYDVEREKGGAYYVEVKTILKFNPEATSENAAALFKAFNERMFSGVRILWVKYEKTP